MLNHNGDQGNGVAIRLRLATLEDSDRLLAWANDPGMREAAFHSDIITQAEHDRWVAAVLDDPARKLYVALVGELPVGVARLDIDRDTNAAEVSLNLAATERRRGLGRAVLEALVEEARGLRIGTLVARIRPTNSRSIRCFSSTAFTPVGNETVAGADALRFERKL